jgi:gliding motility-associated-like protein
MLLRSKFIAFSKVGNLLCKNFSFCAALLICFLFSFTIKAQVQANFSGTPLSGCAPLTVNFTDQSTGNPTSWTWNFGNGNTSTFQNPGATYSNPGTYTVTLTASNGSSSNVKTKTNYITVYAKPGTKFNVSADTACIGQTINFTNTTTIAAGGAPISFYSWDFGDGTAPISTQNVTHSYNAPGNYPVSLITTDAHGCSNTYTIQVVVSPMPVPSFTMGPVFKCTAPLVVTFTNTSTSAGSTTYLWHFGDGSTSNQINPSHTYTASGNYNITLILNQHGCIDSIVKPSAISIQNITASFVATPSLVCSGQAVTFTNTSTPVATTANWVFGDGGTSTTISPAHTYTAAGTYTVALAATDASGCAGNATRTVTVNQTPVAAFTADTMLSCSVPFAVTFSNNATGAATFHWNFGDGTISALQNPLHNYTTPGIYTVTLSVKNGTGTCADSLVKNSFIVISRPLVNFTTVPDSGCVPMAVSFASTSTSSVDPITTYSWNYGNGNSNSTTVVTTNNTYTASGIYSPRLIVQTARGCLDTFVCTSCIKVGVPPVASFTFSPDSVCFGMPVTFINTSTGSTGWKWFFGDGGNSTLQNPLHIYPDTGTFKIKVVAYNNGCTDTSIIEPAVVLAPKAQLNYTLSCTNYYQVQFASTSIGADSVVWDFGDGMQDVSNNISPVHTYTSRGAVTVILTAYNYKSHCVNSITGSFTIAQPIASFTVNAHKGCYPFTATFASTSQDASTYFWNFGDLSTLSDTAKVADTSYTYIHPGRDIVTLTIKDVNGCTSTFKDTLKTLGPLPYFHADTLTGCRPFKVVFTDTTVSDSALVNWTWNFGDGTSIASTLSSSLSHTYTTPGSYNVTMCVTDKNGCKDSITKASYIQPTFPYPAFSVNHFSCKGNVLTFNAGATNAVGPTYTWNFGDGTAVVTSNNPTTTHAYASDNLYHITLKVTDSNGCDSTITDTVLILKPTANFSWSAPNPQCGSSVVFFNSHSTGYPSSSFWAFGDGATSNSLDSCFHTYTQPGIYSASLIVTNPGGCMDTLKQDSIIVVPGPIGTFTFSPTSGCNPLRVTFIAHSSNAQFYSWDFGDGATAPMQTSDSIVHVYNQSGAFTPNLVLVNTVSSGLCPLATPTVGVVTTINSVNVTLTPPVITLPQDSSGHVTANASGGTAPYTYNWWPNNNINCATCANITVTGTGDTLKYTLTTHDKNGCTALTNLLVISKPCIENALIPNIFTPNGDGKNDVFYIPGVCPDDNYSLQIFDRWGNTMFSTQQRNNVWDGKTPNGTDATDGVYYFIVNISKTTYKGFVNLIR